MMAKIWGGMMLAAVVFGLATGRMAEVSSAAIQGAEGAVTLLLAMVGMMCFWSGMMNILQASGAAAAVARLIRPLLRPLFGRVAEDREASELIAANITANLLGLNNAATPIGIRAARRIHELSGGGDRASNALIVLVVLNSASLQLIPTTVAAVRASLGAARPYDILPAVWIASACSVAAGIAAAKLLGRASS